MKTRFTALPLLFCHGIAHGELKWDSQRVEITSGPTDPFVEGAFGFVNAGSEPVTILKLEPSCGCTTVSLPNMTIQPGGRSRVTARFDIGGRRGEQSKTVTVYIKDERMPVFLTLAVTIPDLLKMSPELLAWEKGEAAKPKTILCEAMPGLPVRVVKVASSDTRFQARVETISEGKKYSIMVTPGSTATTGFAVLTIDTEFKDEKKSLRAYVQVKQTRQ